jgi:hypothetical protein
VWDNQVGKTYDSENNRNVFINKFDSKHWGTGVQAITRPTDDIHMGDAAMSNWDPDTLYTFHLQARVINMRGIEVSLKIYKLEDKMWITFASLTRPERWRTGKISDLETSFLDFSGKYDHIVEWVHGAWYNQKSNMEWETVQGFHSIHEGVKANEHNPLPAINQTQGMNLLIIRLNTFTNHRENTSGLGLIQAALTLMIAFRVGYMGKVTFKPPPKILDSLGIKPFKQIFAVLFFIDLLFIVLSFVVLSFVDLLLAIVKKILTSHLQLNLRIDISLKLDLNH